MKETNIEYAEALFQIAKEKDKVQDYLGTLKEILLIVNKNKEYTEFLGSPAIPLTKRLEAVDEAFSGKIPEDIVSFLKILIKNGRIKSLDECIEDFIELELIASSSLNVEVFSSVPLTIEQKTRLTEKLENKYNKKINAAFSEDKLLISGIKVVVEDEVLDGSIKKRLENLKEVIK